MPIETVNIPCNFVETVKVGDNLVLNARLLRIFVERNRNGVFNKLIVMQVSSMVEAGLSEIISRAQNHNREGVPYISEEDRAAIDKSWPEKFKPIMNSLKKYNVLDDLGTHVYDELNQLRGYWIKASPDNPSALSDTVRNWVLGFNIRILAHLSDRFSRPKALRQYEAVLMIPKP